MLEAGAGGGVRGVPARLEGRVNSGSKGQLRPNRRSLSVPALKGSPIAGGEQPPNTAAEERRFGISV